LSQTNLNSGISPERHICNKGFVRCNKKLLPLPEKRAPKWVASSASSASEEEEKNTKRLPN